jgi:hypothetical protein
VFNLYLVTYKVPHASFITAWFIEWCYCIEQHALSDSYLQEMIDKYGQDSYADLKQNLASPGYLKQHMALQKVLQIENVTVPSFIGATQPPFGPFSLLNSLKWDSFLFVDHLIYNFSPLLSATIHKPKFIKLRGWERTILELQITQGWAWLTRFHFWNIPSKKFWAVQCGSIYCEYLGDQDDQCNKNCVGK